MRKNLFSIIIFFKLIFYIKKNNPDIIQCWMYHGDIIGGLVGKILRIKKIFWNLRNSDLNLKWSKKSTIFLAKLSAYLSNVLPHKIISCSNKSSIVHYDLGYCKNKIYLISNGFDKKKFNYSLSFQRYWKRKLKIYNQDVIFGFVGRWSNQKDFDTLFKAFSCFKETASKPNNMKLLLVGQNINKNNQELLKKINKFSLYKNIILIDETLKINQILNVIDIGLFASNGNEGFPNVIAEKMLTNIPCIVADVGDSSRIIGNNGWLYKKRNWIDLNKKINFVYKYFLINKLGWSQKKTLSRSRIINNFSINQMIESYNKIWTQ